MRILLILFLMVSTQANAERRVAFLVGNSQYEHAAPLDNPSRDVALIARTLGDLNFEVTQRNNLGRDAIGRELSAFLRDTKGADVTFFYFAGHGMQYEGRNYLVGTDARLETEFDIDGEALQLDKIVQLLERNSRAALIFIDACRDNPLANQFYTQNFSETRALATRGLAPINTPYQGSMITFSASPGQVAYDGTGQNSPFAAALARHLPTENLEVLSLMKRVIRDVKAETGDLQTPMVTNDLTTEIYLSGAESRPELQPNEAAIFAKAKQEGTLEGWTNFIKLFPDGSYLSAATEERERLLDKEWALSQRYIGENAISELLEVPVSGQIVGMELIFAFKTTCENDHFAKLIGPSGNQVTVMNRGAKRCKGISTEYTSRNSDIIRFFKGQNGQGNWVFSIKDEDDNEHHGTLTQLRLKLTIRKDGDDIEYTARATDLPVAIGAY